MLVARGGWQLIAMSTESLVYALRYKERAARTTLKTRGHGINILHQELNLVENHNRLELKSVFLIR